jgi:hypothetical protein
MFLTRWKDLGPGPESEVWRQHLLPRSSLRSIFLGQYHASVELQTQVESRPPDGYLSSLFGDGDNFNFESLLTSKNIVELFRVQKQCRVKGK